MTSKMNLSGYTAQPAIQQQTLRWSNPTRWIKEAVEDMPSALATQSGTFIESQLNVVSLCAQEILNSIGPGRAVDARGVLIDNSTQRDELIHLSIDLQSIVKNVRTSLKNDRNLTRYAQGFLNKHVAEKRLTDECDRADHLAQRMMNEAAMLQKQITADTAALTNKLLETTTLPLVCISIISQYSIV